MNAQSKAAPDVTVVVPTRDRWPLLERALTGALRQEHVNLEIVVVDDGSRDGTAGRLEELGDSRLRVLRHREAQGVARARNHAIAEARAAWVAFLDDDDYWAPDKLRVQLARATGDVSLVYCGVVFVDADGWPLHVRLPPDRDVGAELTRWNVVGGPSSVLARTEAVRAVGAFDEQLSTFADWDLWLRLADRGRVVAAPAPLVAYVLHAGNMHAGDLAGLLAELDRLREKHRRADRPHELDVDPVALARWLAGGQRRRGQRLSAARTYLSSGLRHRNAGDLLRAAGTVLGEPVLTIGRRLRERDAPEVPAWLALYRQ